MPLTFLHILGTTFVWDQDCVFSRRSTAVGSTSPILICTDGYNNSNSLSHPDIHLLPGTVCFALKQITVRQSRLYHYAVQISGSFR